MVAHHACNCRVFAWQQPANASHGAPLAWHGQRCCLRLRGHLLSHARLLLASVALVLRLHGMGTPPNEAGAFTCNARALACTAVAFTRNLHRIEHALGIRIFFLLHKINLHARLFDAYRAAQQNYYFYSRFFVVEQALRGDEYEYFLASERSKYPVLRPSRAFKLGLARRKTPRARYRWHKSQLKSIGAVFRGSIPAKWAAIPRLQSPIGPMSAVRSLLSATCRARRPLLDLLARHMFPGQADSSPEKEKQRLENVHFHLMTFARRACTVKAEAAFFTENCQAPFRTADEVKAY